MKINTLIGIVCLLFLSSCYPARIIMPLNTKVVDSETGDPIEGAQVLRIVCDIHDFDGSDAKVERGKTDKDGD